MNCDFLLEEYMLTYNIGSLELGKYILAMKRNEERARYLYNSLDKHAVSVVKHIPCNMASVMSSYLATDCNKGSVKIIGERVNCGCTRERSTSSV